MTRIAVTGYKGNIGSRLVKKYGYAPLTCDIRCPKEIEVAINDMKPDLIIHLAGKGGAGKVNWCQAQENEEMVFQVNYRGAMNVFEEADKENIPVVYVSSDHIFSGSLFGGYKESDWPTETKLPKNTYGMSKFAAEGLRSVYPNVYVVRTSTLFWKESPSIDCVLNKIKDGEEVYLPVYMWRSFLHIDHFCELLSLYCQNINDNPPRVLNLSGSEVVSWYRFIKNYATYLGLDTSKIHLKFFEDKNCNYAPRAMRAGLNTNLSKKLGYPQYSYLDGFE